MDGGYCVSYFSCGHNKMCDKNNAGDKVLTLSHRGRLWGMTLQSHRLSVRQAGLSIGAPLTFLFPFSQSMGSCCP